MDINTIMSAQLASLQQTVQLSIMDKAMNMETATAVQLLENMPVQQADIPHPYKGLVVDVSV